MLLVKGFFWLQLVALLAALIPGLRKWVLHREPRPMRPGGSGGADSLPRLAPLACGSCGGTMPLRPDALSCPFCGARATPPADYLRTLELRKQTAATLRRAVRGWRITRVVVSWPSRFAVRLLGVFFAVLSFFSYFTMGLVSMDGGVNGMLGRVMLPLLLMPVLWWLGSLLLARTMARIRARIPIRVGRPSTLAKAEDGACGVCGGPVRFEAEEFATSCGYCGGENYRVAFARRAHTKATVEHVEAVRSLCDAMNEIRELWDDVLSTATVAAVLVLSGCALFALLGLLGGLLGALGCN